jgi:hypothetical protein
MKLEQGQIWQQGEMHYRIVKWSRTAIEYKAMKNPLTKEGTVHQATKKEFCRLLKGATLLTPEKKVSVEEGSEEDSGDVFSA